MTYWLLKSEPNVYSIDDLAREDKTIWDGVRNYQARNFLKQMEKGDLAFFYHSNTKFPGIVGLAKVLDTRIIDPSQFNPQSPYFDPKSTQENPRWLTISLGYQQTFAQPILLTTLKAQFTGDELLLVRKGNRLSVMPVSDRVATQILNSV